MAGVAQAEPYVSEAQLSRCQKPSCPMVTSWLGTYDFTAGATRPSHACRV